MFIPADRDIPQKHGSPVGPVAQHGKPGIQNNGMHRKWFLVFLFLAFVPVTSGAGEWDDEETPSYPESPAVLGPGALEKGDHPALGQTITAGEIAAYDLTIFPDGTGLPIGKGMSADGEILYAEQCQSCHGPSGRGLSAEELVGGIGSLNAAIPELTVGSYWPYTTTLFDYLKRAMPVAHPLSLSADQIYALSAYLLYLNGIITADMILDQETLPRIQMPNRDGFRPIYRLPSQELPLSK